MANELSRLSPTPGSRRPRTRVGRGEGSGKGKTAGRGQKGQHARSTVAAGFEGGQMPLQRRLGKRGFNNIFAKDYATVRLDLIARRFEAGEVVTVEALKERGLVKKVGKDGVKVLGNGDLGHALTVRVHRLTKSAAAKIEAAGGSVEELTA
jgi:large subunit ribosomal protein L15